MKIFKIIKEGDKTNYYFLNHRFLTTKHKSKYSKIYAKRFKGLTEKEMRYCIEKQFMANTGFPLSLDNPQTFNEKLQYLKLYYHKHPNPLMTICSDKVAVRDYIKEKIGEEYLIPCLGVWDNPDDIDFEKLPNQFALKVNWGSGQNIIVKDKSTLDIEKTKKQLSEWMKPESNHYYDFFEPCYKNIQSKVIAEKYIEQIDGQVYDYKFMCFHGKPCWILACKDRGTKTVYENYDIDWNLFVPTPKSSAQATIEKPKHFDKMIEIAEKLSKPFPFVRVDFYEVSDKVYIGELTFVPNSGFNSYGKEYNDKFGVLLDLSKLNSEYVNVI